MAVLRNDERGVERVLRGRSLVGRSPRADVRLTGEATSTEHATVHWNGAEWLLRDLTSRNGTKVNDVRLGKQEWPLVVGDVIVFGDPCERWVWADAAPPRIRATRDDGHVVEEHDGMLLLPDPERPEASVYYRAGRWEVDAAGETRPIEDGDVIVVEGRRFSLDLPCNDPQMNRTREFAEEVHVRSARIEFRPSRDEEHVDIAFEVKGVHRPLPARTFHYMLLVLARARLADDHQGVPPEESGWMYADELAAKLGTTVAKLNVDVHRIRQLVAQLSLFDDSDNIIERRRTTAQLRIGASSFEIAGGRALVR